MKQKISVIVPVYNVEKYLSRCIDSLIRQSYSNIEILLVDDGSKDESLSICKEYEAKDSRIHVFHKENEGLGLTRNYGVEQATGEYITFVDSDDYLTLDAIDSMVKKAVETDADVVIASHYYKNKKQEIELSERLYCGTEIKEILMVHMMGNNGNQLDALSYTAWGKLYKKEIFTKNRLLFPSERKLIWEDLAFSVEAYPLCEKVYILHKPVYYYCFNEGSLTHTYKPKMIKFLNIATYIYTINPFSVMHTSTWRGVEEGKLLFQSVENLVNGKVTEQALMDFWTETAENDWNRVFRANLTIMKKKYIFDKFMQEPLYLRFSDRNIKQYSSKKQKIYLYLIRKKAVWRLMGFAYCRMIKNEIKSKLCL